MSETLLNKKYESGIQKKSAARPDGWRSWVVAFANFFINFIVVGLGRMSGILYVVFMQMFHINRQTASMPFSIQQAARNFFGPLAGILGQKYGVRGVTIIGGVVGTLSAMGCYFALNITWITVLWGIMFGVCTALTTTLNQVPIDQYFERHRTTAGGFAFSGGCVAAFIFPVVLEGLISLYGMAYTFLAMGVFTFFVIPSAMFLVEPPWKNQDLIEEIKTNETHVNYNTFDPNISSLKKTPEEINFEYLRRNSEFVFQLFMLTISDDVASSESMSETLWNCLDTLPLVNELECLYNNLQIYPESATESTEEKNELTHSVHVVEVTINGFPTQNSTDINSEDMSPDNFKKYGDSSKMFYLSSKLRELCSFRQQALLLYFPSSTHTEVINILKMLQVLNESLMERDNPDSKKASPPFNNEDLIEIRRMQQKRLHEEKSNSFTAHIMTALRLHTNPIFLLICLCRGVFMLTFIPLVTIIVDFAMDKGLNQSTGKYIIAILSLGDLLGRLCLGWINDSGCLSLPKYMLVAMILLSISTSTLPLMHSEVSLMPAVLIFGMLQGSLFIRHQILVSKYMNIHEQAIGMGFINLLSGFIGFALPFYIGYFRDTLGSYDNMFYLNGAICLFVGLMWIFEPVFVRFSSKPALSVEDA